MTKAQIAKKQHGNCALSGTNLPQKAKLYDLHRKIPKCKGGELTEQNVCAANTVPHMQLHETYKQRQEELESLKAIIDDRQQVMKLHMKINNQLLAYQRKTDHLNDVTLAWLKEQGETVIKRLMTVDKQLTKFVKHMETPIAKACLSVKGVGPVTVAYCLTYLEIEKARHASCFWKYTGLHCASHERYTKGEPGGGNKTLRTMLYTMAESQVKTRGDYRQVYDNMKFRLEHSDKITKSRNTKGQLIEVAWKDTKPGHRHGAALRAIMKHFLADLWWVWRTLEGLETSPLYPEAHLGSTHKTIMPEERGWKY